MTRRRHLARRARWLALGLVVLGAAGATGSARAEEAPSCTSSTDAPYTMQLKALTGPAGADLTVSVTAASGCALPETLKKIQIKTFDGDGNLADTSNATDEPAPGGVASLKLGAVPRDRRVEADVLVQTGTPERTYVVRGTTRTLLRPDVVVASVDVPASSLVTTKVPVSATVKELTGDVDAHVTVELRTLLGTLAAKDVTVPAHDGAGVAVDFGTFDLTQPVATELTVAVKDAAPAETDVTNNTRVATVDMIENAVDLPQVLVPWLAGYGNQFNNHVYAPITPWPPGVPYDDFEQKVKNLEPQLVRIFFNDRWDANALGEFNDTWERNYQSFVDSCLLAQDAGATIAISYQNLSLITTSRWTPERAMTLFADTLEKLVREQGCTNVRWAEVGNEPNSGAITQAKYQALVQSLHDQLVARGLHEQIRLMGPGLVENAGNADRDHYAWMQWITTDPVMSTMFDAYAEHVYWQYFDTGRLEYRARDVWHLMNEVVVPEQRKPVYMMEFGVRGWPTCGSKPTASNTYYRDSALTCPDIWRTNIAGFQQLWFAIASAQTAVAGAAKWDAYWGVYDKTISPPQVYWTIGPASEGSPLTPSYWALSMLFHTTVPGWQIVRALPWDESDWGVPEYRKEGHSANDTPEKELAAYSGPNGEVTVIGLDTHGKLLNEASSDPPSSYSIGGLPAGRTFNLAIWNATGDGTNSIAPTVTTNAAGVARFEVPLHAAFALTTVPVS